MTKKKPATAPPKPKKEPEAHRHCPRCYGRFQGIGEAYKTSGPKTYYKCNHCGYGFHRPSKQNGVEVTHREPEVETRGGK